MIKTKIIKTYNAELLVVGGLPEATTHVWLVNGGIEWRINGLLDRDRNFYEIVDISKDHWQLLGKLYEITDEQWMDIVPFKYFSSISETRYFLYNREYDYLATTAKKSGLSLIEANVKLENKYGNKQPDRSEYNFGFGHNEAEHYEQVLKAWQQEEEQVFRNPVVFVKGK